MRRVPQEALHTSGPPEKKLHRLRVTQRFKMAVVVGAVCRGAAQSPEMNLGFLLRIPPLPEEFSIKQLRL